MRATVLSSLIGLASNLCVLVAPAHADSKTSPVAETQVFSSAAAELEWLTGTSWKMAEVSRSAPSVTPLYPTIYGDYLIYAAKATLSEPIKCSAKNLYAQPLKKRGAEVLVAELLCVKDIFALPQALVVHARLAVAVKEEEKSNQPTAYVDKLLKFTDFTQRAKVLSAWEGFPEFPAGSLPSSRVAFVIDSTKSTAIFNPREPGKIGYQFAPFADSLLVLTSMLSADESSVTFIDAFNIADAEPKLPAPMVLKNHPDQTEFTQVRAMPNGTLLLAYKGNDQIQGKVRVVSTEKKTEITEFTLGSTTSSNYPAARWEKIPVSQFGIRAPDDLVPLTHGFIGREAGATSSWEFPFVFYYPSTTSGAELTRIPALSGVTGKASIRAAPGGFLVSTESPDSVQFLGNENNNWGSLVWGPVPE
jgi:hypothetical protein